jgi:hypothetical protein
MRLENRLKKLEELVPSVRRKFVKIPTESLAAFCRGLLRREFTPADIDHTDFDQSTAVGQFAAAMVVLGPSHQAWCDRSGWGRGDQDAWEQRTFSTLTPDEMCALRNLAKQWNEEQNPEDGQ